MLLFTAAFGCSSGSPQSSPSGDESATNSDKENSEMSNPIVTIEMENGGIITIELYPDIAPNTVNNFISLVEDGF